MNYSIIARRALIAGIALFFIVLGWNLAHAETTLDVGTTSSQGIVDGTGVTVQLESQGKLWAFTTKLTGDYYYDKAGDVVVNDKGSAGLNVELPFSRTSKIWADQKASFNNVYGRDLETYTAGGLSTIIYDSFIRMKTSYGLTHSNLQGTMGSLRASVKRDGKVLDTSIVVAHRHDTTGYYEQDYRAEVKAGVRNQDNAHVKLVFTGESRKHTTPNHTQALFMGVTF